MAVGAGGRGGGCWLCCSDQEHVVAPLGGSEVGGAGLLQVWMRGSLSPSNLQGSQGQRTVDEDRRASGAEGRG